MILGPQRRDEERGRLGCERENQRSGLEAGGSRARSAMLTFGLGTMVSALAGGIRPHELVQQYRSYPRLPARPHAIAGYACGGILIALAFCPKLVALLTIVPPPVAGAMFLLVVPTT